MRGLDHSGSQYYTVDHIRDKPKLEFILATSEASLSSLFCRGHLYRTTFCVTVIVVMSTHTTVVVFL